MLTELRLRNFRCFTDHTIPFRPLTIIVGQNNAGKSTIVEALRLVAVVENRYQALNFNNVPDWLDIPRRNRGVRPSLEGLEINLDSLFHRYGNPPAQITAAFESGERIEIYIGSRGDVFGVIFDPRGNPITTKGQARQISLPDVSTLPQVAPLAREEVVLRPDYVRRAVSSVLAPLHFRNQLNLFYAAFVEFRRLAESSWHGLRIVELRGHGGLPETPLALLLRDGAFVAEAAWMGHGLQMWLQTMWFLARTGANHSIILDEPDVYMHADLQRKLIRMVRGRYRQAVIATHSVEMMAEVEPEHVLIVDRTRPSSTFAPSLPAVQRVVQQIGGVHNLQLARLWASRKCLLVEGKDLGYLKRFQNLLFPHSDEPIDTLPHASIGGWSGWNYAVGSSLILRNAVGESITTYCVLDSDYHTDIEIQARLNDARERGIELHIWGRKEIENYLLLPAAIARVVASERRKGPAPTSEMIADQLDNIANEMKDGVYESLTNEIYIRNKAAGTAPAMRLARTRLDRVWGSRHGRLGIVSGKEALSALSKWAMDVFGVGLGGKRLAQELTLGELPEEVVAIMSAIESGQPMPVR